MTAIESLQEWYLAQCDGDWEHGYGVSIDTLDNPGWALKINLVDTHLEGVPFLEHSYGTGPSADSDAHNWIHCVVKDNQFQGHGGPTKLEEMINVFLSWAKAARKAPQ